MYDLFQRECNQQRTFQMVLQMVQMVLRVYCTLCTMRADYDVGVKKWCRALPVV